MDQRASNLEILRAQLSELDLALEDDQCRGVLKLVLERRVPSVAPSKSDPKQCPNCSQPVASSKSPYCSERCKAMAAFIRQFRGGVAEGGLLDPEKQVGSGQALWSLLGGGFPRRITLIPARVIQQVIKRDGACRVCGGEPKTVDHVRTACNRPINLQAVCGSCGRTRPYGDQELLSRGEVQSLLDEIAGRALAETCVRACDDPASWDWRAFLEQRKSA